MDWTLPHSMDTSPELMCLMCMSLDLFLQYSIPPDNLFADGVGGRPEDLCIWTP